MDALKQKFGNESPEERKKRKKSMVCPNVFNLALCIAMVVVGAKYNNEEDCRSGDAPLFLLLGGGIVLATTAMKLIAYLTPCEQDDRIMTILTPIADFANFCVIIWGSVVVFGAYRQWVYEESDKISEHYCAYTPFKFAFVILIIYWILFPFVLCCEMMFCFFTILYKIVENSDTPDV